MRRCHHAFAASVTVMLAAVVVRPTGADDFQPFASHGPTDLQTPFFPALQTPGHIIGQASAAGAPSLDEPTSSLDNPPRRAPSCFVPNTCFIDAEDSSQKDGWHRTRSGGLYFIRDGEWYFIRP